MLEKYGVVQDPTPPKTAAPAGTCPTCGGAAENHSGVKKCPKCGTKPFETAKP